MNMQAKRRGKVRTGIWIIVVVGGLLSALSYPVMNLIWPLSEPGVVQEIVSPDGQTRLVITARQLNRFNPEYAYYIAMTDADKKPLPGDPRIYSAGKTTFTAQWGERGVEVFLADDSRGFVGSGQLVDGRQVWSDLRFGQIPRLPLLPPTIQ